MKGNLLFILLLVGAFSCQKKDSGSLSSTPPARSSPNYSSVQQYLNDSMPAADYDKLVFSDYSLSTTDTGRTYFFRIPFLGTSITQKFVLVKADNQYSPIQALVVQIRKDSMPGGISPTPLSFSGGIEVYYLSGALDFSSAIAGGYIQEFHDKTVASESVDDVVELPEIVIYAPDVDYYASWDMILDEGGGNSGGFSGYSSSAASGGGGSSSAASSVNSYADKELAELQATKPAILINKYLDCFASILSDASTVYSVSLLVRVPDPSNPDVMWDPTIASGIGHTFLEITKSNGSESITQYIGFYGQGGVAYSAATALGFNVPSKLVDNSAHPYNASLTLSLNAGQFSDLLTSVQNYSMAKYNLSSYNCTDYALSVYNSVASQDLNVPVMAIPGQVPGETPNGLFKELQSLPSDGPYGKVNISDATLTAGTGHGACN